MRRNPSSRRVMRPLLTVLGAGLVAAGAGHLVLAQPAPAPASSVLASLRLTSVSAGTGPAQPSPLFSVADLTPGHPQQRCTTVVGAGAGSVVFGARRVQGDLAPHLQVVVMTGTGLDAGCSDFVADGTAVYAGTLDGLAATTIQEGGLDTGWRSTAGQQRAFRLSVEVLDDPRALGAGATADFVWSTDAVPSPPAPTSLPTPLPTPVPTDVPTDVPTQVPTDVPAPPVVPAPGPTDVAPDSAVTTDPDAIATGAPTAGPTRSPGPATTAPERQDPLSPTDGARPVVPHGATTPPADAVAPVATPTREPTRTGPAPTDSTPTDPAATGSAGPGSSAASSDVAEKLLKTSLAVARYGSFPLFLLLIALVYLLVQDRIDRRDPKLAQAPVGAAAYQSVPDEGAVPWQNS